MAVQSNYPDLVGPSQLPNLKRRKKMPKPTKKGKKKTLYSSYSMPVKKKGGKGNMKKKGQRTVY